MTIRCGLLDVHALGDVVSLYQLGSVAFVLELVYYGVDVVSEVLFIVPSCHPVYTTGGTFIQPSPALPYERFVQLSIEIAETMRSVGSRLVGYGLQ